MLVRTVRANVICHLENEHMKENVFITRSIPACHFVFRYLAEVPISGSEHAAMTTATLLTCLFVCVSADATRGWAGRMDHRSVCGAYLTTLCVQRIRYTVTQVHCTGGGQNVQCEL